jgi:RNA polymerase sigma factor (sigma-70 family)
MSSVAITDLPPPPSGPSGNDPAFDALYRERYEQMVRLAAQLVDLRAVAEDIVQEAFHKLWLRWSQVEAPMSYLRSTVVNACHNELRKRRVRRDAHHKLFDRPDGFTEYLADALAGISERRRHAIVLRFYGDRTMSEIAEAMDIPTGTAKSLIHRGLADLRVAFD